MTYSDQQVEQIACACHEANRAYCVTLGDPSQVAWADAPEWQRASATAGVRGHLSGKISSPEQSHEAWLAGKAADGWRYGAVKDAEKKEHPCFVPYADLPPEQQEKDRLFAATIAAELAKL